MKSNGSNLASFDFNNHLPNLFDHFQHHKTYLVNKNAHYCRAKTHYLNT